MKDFLITSREEMDKKGINNLDFIIISGDAYVDHPSFGSVLLARGVGFAVFISWSLSRGIAKGIDMAASAAQLFGEGDLSQALPQDGKDEIAHLLQALTRMQTSLVGVVQRVRVGSESVATASAERLMMLIVQPMIYMKIKAIISEQGIVRAMISEVRKERRKMRVVKTTKRPP